ncbi:hypothetical protein ACHAWF_015160 [Thalassiosira exigua]
MGLSLQQRKIASILPHIVGLLSWLGSLSIIVDVIRKYRKNGGRSDAKPKAYHRLMMGMSTFDVIASTGYMMSTWPIPADTPEVWEAHGNDATCNAQGFILQMGIGTPFYNLSLAMYYYLVIVKNSPPDGKWTEKIMHMIGPVVALSTSVTALALGMYGNSNFWCWITVEFNLFRWLFWFGPLWAIIVLIAVIMAVIYYNILRQEHRQRRWRASARFTTNTNTGNATANGSGGDTSAARRGTIKGYRNKRSPKSRASDIVRWQAFSYVGSLLITWSFQTINRAVQGAGVDSPGWLLVAAVAFVPSQGIFNLLIYLRPRYKELRKKEPHVGMLVAWIRVHPFFTCCTCCDGGSKILKLCSFAEGGRPSFAGRSTGKASFAGQSVRGSRISPERQTVEMACPVDETSQVIRSPSRGPEGAAIAASGFAKSLREVLNYNSQQEEEKCDSLGEDREHLPALDQDQMESQM